MLSSVVSAANSTPRSFFRLPPPHPPLPLPPPDPKSWEDEAGVAGVGTLLFPISPDMTLEISMSSITLPEQTVAMSLLAASEVAYDMAAGKLVTSSMTRWWCR